MTRLQLALLALVAMVTLTGALTPEPAADAETLRLPMSVVLAGLGKVIWDLRAHIARSTERHDSQERLLLELERRIDTMTLELRRQLGQKGGPDGTLG